MRNLVSAFLSQPVSQGAAVSIAGGRALRAVMTAAVFSTGAAGWSAPALAQHVYPTPEAAADALGDAIARSDSDALGNILGKSYMALVPAGSVNQQDVYEFLAAWHLKHAIAPDGDRRANIEVGGSGWTFPVPLVKQKNGWQFDLTAGKAEVHRRRLGRNELVAMETLQTLADAQQRYADGPGNGRYAKQLVSSPGKTNGLYWPSLGEADASPVGADALAMGPDTPVAEAFFGYHYRVLPGSGDNKYAFVAWPATYGDTGVHTFLLGSDRVFYERDLGPSTASRAKAIRSYAPSGWSRVSDSKDAAAGSAGPGGKSGQGGQGAQDK